MKHIDHLEIAGIGFGPAAISLACVIDDYNGLTDQAGQFSSVTFFEKQDTAQWHPKLLPRGPDINHSFLRDLVTPVNPRSRFSFANFLHSQQRLYEFGLLGRPPSRIEWSQYVNWAASQLKQYVSYSDEITELTPEIDDDRLVKIGLKSKNRSYKTDRLILANGPYPFIPEIFKANLGHKIFHTNSYLTSVSKLDPQRDTRFLVVGSGQSASEVVQDLLVRNKNARIYSMHQSMGFKMTQLSPFSNEVFSPSYVDYFHSLTHEQRAEFLRSQHITNYAGLDLEDCRALYSLVYEERLIGEERLNLIAHQKIIELINDGQAIEVIAKNVHNGEITQVPVDCVILATGYEQPAIPPLLSALLPWLELDSGNAIDISKNYEVRTTKSDVKIYACGISERTHGLGDALSFSLVAIRAKQILDSIIASRTRHHEQPKMVSMR